MGWVNYLIIPSWKLAIQISRHVDDIEEYQLEALNSITVDEEYESLDEVKIKNLTIRTLSLLYKAWEELNELKGISPSQLLIYFLKSREIDYEIKSEFNVDIKKLKKKGYKIVEW